MAHEGDGALSPGDLGPERTAVSNRVPRLTVLDEVPAGALATAAMAVARRFAAGATMWCVSAAWPEHARHVAVEFVHPVVMGTRALPAVALTGPRMVQGVRAAARAGDLLVALGPSSDGELVELVRRAPAWGLETVWIGSGDRPVHSQPSHVLWAEEDGSIYDGQLVLLYHVLWELTHVCFEHPGLLRAPTVGVEASCTTCSDEGRLAEVVDSDDSKATVRTARGVEQVDVTLVGRVETHDLLLVHAGVAIEIVP